MDSSSTKNSRRSSRIARKGRTGHDAEQLKAAAQDLAPRFLGAMRVVHAYLMEHPGGGSPLILADRIEEMGCILADVAEIQKEMAEGVRRGNLLLRPELLLPFFERLLQWYDAAPQALGSLGEAPIPPSDPGAAP